MAQNGGRIDFQVGLKTDQSSFNQLKSSLQGLSKIKIADFNGTNQDLKSVRNTANQVQRALQKAFNVNLNSVNVKSFTDELSKAGLSVDKIYSQFSKAGAQGQVVFSQMASSVLTTNLQLKETNSLIDSMGKTMVNTVKWGIASSVMNTFTQSVQSAFSYIQSLEKSLTDIRIVTGDSQQRMEQFAISANKAAAALGRSTMDYTKSSLTFFQQGLDAESVAARTEAVLKAQNITGTGSQMADYLTSVWNGYKVANEQAQLYVDKLAAVADSSASDMSQLAIAMSKVASTANVMGVDIDQLNAQLATVVATTRMAPESVGTAFKTIYSRLNDIKAGSDEAEISLGNYSSKMASLGFNVLDASGKLRDTGQVMQEIGGRWKDLTRQQQVYLAQTMGGQRQITQVMALFDNWDTYVKLLNTSLESQGTLMEKNSRYMESLGAKMEQLGAASERVKYALLDAQDMKGLVDVGTNVVNLFANLIESLGGGSNALLTFGSLLTQVFSGAISKELNSIVTNLQNIKYNAEIKQQDILMTQSFGKSQGYSSNTISEMIEAKRQIQEYYGVISDKEIESYNNIVKEIGASKEQVTILQEKISQVEKFNQALQIQSQKAEGTGSIDDQLILAIDNAEKLKQTLDNIQGPGGLKLFQDFDSGYFSSLLDQIDELENTIGADSIPAFKNFDAVIKQVSNSSSLTAVQFNKIREAAKAVFQQAYEKIGLSLEIDQIEQAAKRAGEQLKLAKQKADEFLKGTSQLATVQSFVSMASSIGQVASGLNTLKNIYKNVWTNQNLSAGERVLQTFTSMGTAIPMVVTSLIRMKTITQTLSHTLINHNTIQRANLAVTQAQATLEKANLAVKEASIAVSKGQAGAEQLLKAAKLDQAAATEIATEAQNNLNAAMEANPIGGILITITAVVVAIYGLIKVYDHFTISTEEATQAIEKFNEKQKEVQTNTQNYNKNITQLEKLKKQYDELAEKAGASSFDSNIDSLTQAERERYNQIKDLIVSYNEQALAGYTAQGQAILKNNGYLEQTIQLLKKKRQQEIDNLYNSEEYQDAQKGRQKIYQNNVEKKEYNDTSFDKFMDNTLYGGGSLQLLRRDPEKFSWYEEQLKKLQQIQNDGIANLGNHLEELNQISSQIETVAKNNNDEIVLSGLQGIRNALDNIKAYAEQNSVYAQQVQTQLEESSKFAISDILLALQASTNNQQYSELAKSYGQGLLNSLITSYTNGLSLADFSNQEQAIAKIKEDFLQVLIKANISKEEIDGIQKTTINSLNEVQSSLSTAGYNQMVETLIQQIYEGDEKLKDLADHHPETFKLLMESLFGVDIGNFHTNDGKVIIDNIVSEYNNLYDEAKQKIEEYTKNRPASSEDMEGVQRQQALALLDQLNNFTLQHFDQIFAEASSRTGNLADNLRDVIDEFQKLNTATMQIDSGINALNLLAERDAGGKLNTKQTEALYEGLAQLQAVYPQLEKQVQILNNSWLQGTGQYLKALDQVKNSIYQSFSALGNYSDQNNDKLLALINSTQDLQSAMKFNSDILDTDPQFYSNALIKVASQYESCADQLNKYLQARQYGNQIEKEAAQFELEIAARSQENGQKYGITAERISSVADQFVRLAEAGQAGYEGLDQNAELASDAAVRYIRLNDALSDLYDNLDDYKEVLAQANQGGVLAIRSNEELSDTFDKLKDDVAGILDTSQQLLGDDWVAKNMQNIIAAAQGSEEAISALRQSFGEEIFLNLGIDWQSLNAQLDDSYNSVWDWANSLPEGVIDADNLPFLQKLVDAMQEAGYARQEIENALSGIGIDVDLQPMVNAENEAIDLSAAAGRMVSDAFAVGAGINASLKTQTASAEDNIQAAGFETKMQDISSPVVTPQFGYAVTPTDFGISMIPMLQGVQTAYVHYPSVITSPTKSDNKAKKETTATALQVVGATKSSGGQISHINTPAARAAKTSTPKTSTPRTSTPRTSTPKTSTPKTSTTKTKKPASMKPIKQERDRYHDVNIEISRLDHQLEQIEDKQEKLAGKDIINGLNDQLQILEKQVQKQQEKLELQKEQADELQRSLMGQGVRFNGETGQITNYQSIMYAKLQSLNSVIQAYNSMSAQQQQSYKENVQQAKQTYQNFKSELERYDDLISSEIPNQNKKIRDLLDKQIQLQVEAFKVSIDLQLDLSKAKRDFNKFKKQVIDQLRDDNILGNTYSKIQDLFSYYDHGGAGAGLIEDLSNHLNETLDQLQQIDSKGFSSIYGDDRAQALQDLNKYNEELMENLQSVEDLLKDIKESFFDMVDAAQDAFDEQSKEYEFLGDLIEHDKKLIQLVYGEEAFDKINNYYQKQKQNDKNEIDFQRQQKEFWYAQMQAQKARMSEFDKESNEYKEAQDRFKELEQHWLDAVKDFNSKVEDSINNLLDSYKNSLSIIFKDLENKLTGDKGLDYLNEEWQLINDNADRYLDRIDAMYEIQKLQNAYQDAIDDNVNNLNAQKSLNDMMQQQLKMLRDKEKITQYDIERANALLQIQVKRLALEQAQQSKTKLRLRRDSQGNYTYQYTADQAQVSESQQSLLDARNSLYNLDKNQYKNNLNDIYSLQSDFNKKLQDLYQEYPVWTQQAQQKRRLLVEQYGDQINGLVEENETIRLNLMDSAFDELANLYDADVDNFINMSRNEQDELMSNLIPQWNSGLQEMANTFAGAGGFIPVCQQAFNDLHDTTEDYESELDDLKNIAEINFEQIADGIDEDIDRTEDLIDVNDQLIDGYSREIDAINEVIDYVGQLTDQYRQAKQEAIAATDAAYRYWQQQNQRKAIANQVAAARASASSTPSVVNSSNGSTGYSYSGGNNSSNNNTASKNNSNSGGNKNQQKARTASQSVIEGIAADIWINGAASGWSNDPTRRARLIQKFDTATANAVQSYINAHAMNGDIIRSWGNRIGQLSKYHYSSFDTGGYTGQWGNNGKIGILHEKEIVLDENDTKNLLNAVAIVRTMDNLLGSITPNINLSNSLSGFSNSNNGGSLLDQNVHITATFPNVNSRLEIEQALGNLVNRASQYAFNTRR